MKDSIKQLVPPVLLKILKAAPSRIFSSYDEAYSACGVGAYDAEGVVKVIMEKNAIFRRSGQTVPALDLTAMRTIIGVGLASGAGRLNVLDFGGGGGYHHALARAALGDRARIRWSIVETPAMVREAQRIADTDLTFFDNIGDARNKLGNVDLVFTSSALQYCRDPLGTLKTLTEVGAQYLFLTRTPFSESENSLVSIQVSKLSNNGPGPLPKGFSDRDVVTPITFESKHAVECMLREKYQIRFSINEDRGVFSAGKHKFDMTGYFCEKR